MKIYIVEWKDSASFSGWRDREEVKEKHVCPICSVGIILAERPAEIVLVSHLAGADVEGTMVIPKACITRIHQLKVRRTK